VAMAALNRTLGIRLLVNHKADTLDKHPRLLTSLLALIIRRRRNNNQVISKTKHTEVHILKVRYHHMVPANIQIMVNRNSRKTSNRIHIISHPRVSRRTVRHTLMEITARGQAMTKAKDFTQQRHLITLTVRARINHMEDMGTSRAQVTYSNLITAISRACITCRIRAAFMGTMDPRHLHQWDHILTRMRLLEDLALFPHLAGMEPRGVMVHKVNFTARGDGRSVIFKVLHELRRIYAK